MIAEACGAAGVAASEPTRDIRALLPTSTQGRLCSGGADSGGLGQPAGPTLQATGDSALRTACDAGLHAESEEVTDEPPREKTKADVQREQIIRALKRNNGRRREAAAETVHVGADIIPGKSGSWASKMSDSQERYTKC